MPDDPVLEPLPRGNRRITFIVLLVLFVVSLPFLYLYATGYRFEFGEQTNLVSTGGIYVAAERTGAEIFIDDELVRETRVFRRAFYAQNLEPGTHKVHVQKEDHNTWVKELPVSPHLVTEAQAFNLPLVPQLRVISEWQSATGSAVVREFTLHASTTNEYIATTTKETTHFIKDTEYASLLRLFAPTSTISLENEKNTTFLTITHTVPTSSLATTTETIATTTKEWQGVRLYEDGEDVYAVWIGSQEDMPYYYCAEDFPRYSTSTTESVLNDAETEQLLSNVAESAELIHPVQTLPEDLVCNPSIRLDRRSQQITAFDFFPGSTDLVILALEDGLYVVEIDNRGWQNIQPLLLGRGLDMRIENGQIYVYDGELFYHIILET